MIRVTESLDHFKTESFFQWRLKVGEREANAVGKRSAKVGNRIDEIIKSGIYKVSPKDGEKVKKCLQGFLQWRDRYSVGTIRKLERITDHRLGLTGEPDLFWEEERCLIDLKATGRIWPHHMFQLGGYRRLGVDCKSAAILRLDPETGGFEYMTNEQLGLTLDDLVDAYESAYKHFRYYIHIDQQLTGEPHGYDVPTEVSSNT